MTLVVRAKGRCDVPSSDDGIAELRPHRCKWCGAALPWRGNRTVNTITTRSTRPQVRRIYYDGELIHWCSKGPGPGEPASDAIDAGRRPS